MGLTQERLTPFKMAKIRFKFRGAALGVLDCGKRKKWRLSVCNFLLPHPSLDRLLTICKPGAVARSDAPPPGMRTVAGSILRCGKFFRGDWS